MYLASLFFLVFLVSLCNAGLSKWLTNKEGRATTLLLQYLFVALIAFIVARPKTLFSLEAGQGLILFLGLLNALACCFYWRASAISLSKSATMVPYQHLLAMGFAVLFLGEWEQLNLLVIVSGLICIAGTFLITRSKDDSALLNSMKQKFLRCSALFSLFWGITLIGAKYFASTQLPVTNYLFYYYLGSLFGAIIFYSIALEDERTPISREIVVSTGLVSTLVYAISYLVYLIYTAAPLVIAQPILMLVTIITPYLIGLLVFQEKKLLKRFEWYGIAMSSTGALLLVMAISLP